METVSPRPPTPLLRTFFDPAHPLELKSSAGGINGPGVWYDPVPLESFTALPGAVVAGPGAVRIPFDPEDALDQLVLEGGGGHSRPLYTFSPFESHMTPAIVRWLLLRNDVRGRLMSHTAFPRWPAEPCAEDIRTLVREAFTRAGIPIRPAPFWPNGAKYAAALTHDIDSVEVWKSGLWKPFADLEEANGLRSSWHVCTSHMKWAEPAVEELARRGHEIGWHGPRHDYRIAWMPERERAAAIEKARPFFARFGVRGFRSPNYLRTPALFRSLEGTFGYDSSSIDTAAEPFHPRTRTGCSTVFPFFRGSLLEIPITVPDGLTIRCLAGDDADSISAVQAAKIGWIRAVGGLALAITHPERWISMRPAPFTAYRRLVESISGDAEAWKALPREVESWWRKRHTMEA
jgi:peptidoglycan/xylan/chitin deacetylase (PgdA/CDA1 family)